RPDTALAAAPSARPTPGGSPRCSSSGAPCRPSGEPCSAKTCREILQPPIVPQATWSAPLPLFHCSSEIAPSRSTSCRSAHPQNSPNQGRVAKVGLGSSATAGVRLIVWCRDCSHQVEPDP